MTNEQAEKIRAFLQTLNDINDELEEIYNDLDGKKDDLPSALHYPYYGSVENANPYTDDDEERDILEIEIEHIGLAADELYSAISSLEKIV